VLDDLRAAAAPHGLTFGPDPATHTHCTLGGMLGNNSCGVHSLLSTEAGLGMRTSDNTHALEVLTYAGERMRVGRTPPDELARVVRAGGARGATYRRLAELRDRLADTIRARFPVLPRRVSGYNLDELLPENDFNVARALVGSEGTLVGILQATLHLVPDPPARSLLLVGYPDVFAAGDDVMEVRGFGPVGLEGIDRLLYEWMQDRGDKDTELALLPDGEGFLLVEFGGEDQREADAKARRCMEALRRSDRQGARGPRGLRLISDPHEQERVWKVREGALGSTAWVPGRPDTWPGWEDSAVPPERIGPYLRDLRALFDRHRLKPSLYGHLGQGCVHCRVGFDLYSRAGVERYRAFAEEAADLVVSHGGSLSGEHGDGQARGELLERMFGAELVDGFRELKRIFDPDGKMNPGKVVDAYPLDANLRLGPDYAPPQPATHFRYPDDSGSFARAALRCVGVGKCRRKDGGTMCPSYMVTGEERHSTRGRARLLFEMLNGEVLTDGWKSAAVKDALDLCLACKGCKGECPVQVDMATYKAEFNAQHWAGRLRPRHAYALGWIHRWARAAALAPSLVNLVAGAPLVSRALKRAAGLTPERELPRFARRTFKAWFRARGTHGPADGPAVILWPDTFNDHFHPHIARAAVEVLEAAGFRVEVPRAALCCGRPLYDFGMLDLARELLVKTLDALAPRLEAGVPVVGLEPSCVSVFRDELPNMLPDDPRARLLQRQTFLLAELLASRSSWRPPELPRKVLLHGHCHQKAVLGMDADVELLAGMGVDLELPDTGCCGLAGSFGWEHGEHYDVSMACGERVLFPAVRAAAKDTLVVTDGFSCGSQIEHGTRRRPLHLAEVLRLAMDGKRGEA
jgi:Fe-S oxidoreductase/FAD/FMN-containing dehydrogenase